MGEAEGMASLERLVGTAGGLKWIINAFGVF